MIRAASVLCGASGEDDPVAQNCWAWLGSSRWVRSLTRLYFIEAAGPQDSYQAGFIGGPGGGGYRQYLCVGSLVSGRRFALQRLPCASVNRALRGCTEAIR